MSVTEQRIREFAYQIWQLEGCPEGQHLRHWEMACQLAEAEAHAQPSKPPTKRKTTTRKTRTPRKAASATPQPADETVTSINPSETPKRAVPRKPPSSRTPKPRTTPTKTKSKNETPDT